MPGLQTPTDTSSDLHHLPVSCASGELTQEQLNWAAAANSRHSVHSRGVRRFNPFPLTPAKRPLAQHRARAPRPGPGTGHAQSPPASCSPGNLCTPSPGCSLSPPPRRPPRLHPGLLRSTRPRFLPRPRPSPARSLCGSRGHPGPASVTGRTALTAAAERAAGAPGEGGDGDPTASC